MRIYKIILLACSLLSVHLCTGQSKSDTTQLPTDSLLVQKNVTLNFQEFEYVDWPIAYSKESSIIPSIDVVFPKYDYEFERLTPSIKPLRYQLPAKPKINDGWLRLGMGNPNRIVADAGYDYTITDWYGFGANFYHQQSKLKSAFRTFKNEIFVDLHGHYFLTPSIKAFTNIEFGSNQWGIQNVNLEKDETEILFKNSRRNNDFTINLGLHGTPYEKYNLTYGIHANYNNYSLYSEQSFQQTIATKGFVKYKLSEPLMIKIEALSKNLITQSYDQKQNDNLWAITPSLQYKLDLLDTEIGFLIDNDNTHKVDPILHIRYTTDQIPLSIHLYTDSKSKMLGMKEIVAANPYAAITIPATTRFHHDSYGLNLGYLVLNNTIQFGYSYNDINNDFRFDYNSNNYLYSMDTVDYQMHQFTFLVESNPLSWLRYNLTYNHFQYIEETQLNYFPRNTVELNIGFNFFQDKLRIKSKSLLIDRHGYLDENSMILDLDPIVDLSLSLDYLITDRISIFASANNLLNKRYLQWREFQSYGFSTLSGVTVVF